jgi:hypothetical protein
MNPYLEKQLPLLGDLHKKLGLCQQDLDTDLEAINDAIKRAIDEAIGRRKETVKKLEEDVEAARTEIRGLRRLLDPEHGVDATEPEPMVSAQLEGHGTISHVHHSSGVTAGSGKAQIDKRPVETG